MLMLALTILFITQNCIKNYVNYFCIMLHYYKLIITKIHKKIKLPKTKKYINNKNTSIKANTKPYIN